jgi:iron complex outermembrane receptor protein
VGGACPAGQQLFFNGQSVFLNPFGAQTAAGDDYLRSNTVLGEVQNGESTIQGLTGVLSRSFGNLAGGPITAALLAEFRKEDMVYNTDIALVSQAASSGLAGSGATRAGDRDITALGIEMSFPVLKNLELGFSLRYDDYSDFGSTTNPKISFKYNPTQAALIRGSYNTGFAAPSLYNLYLPNSTTFTSNRYNDPVLCPGGVANTGAGAVASRDCNIQFQQLQGGNTSLQPEESEAWTIGFVLQPTPTLSFGVDYWDYHIKDSISTIGEATVFNDPAKYAALFVRCSQADPARRNAIGACQVAGGDPLAYIINTNLNLGDVKARGLDLQFNWSSGATQNGTFTVGARGTYIIKYEFQVEPNGEWFDPVGNFSRQFATTGGPVIRYQQITNFGWTRNAYGANLIYRFKSGYKDHNNVPAPYNDNTVGDYHIFDLALSYTGIKGLSLQAGVLNLFDRDPPYTNQTAQFQARGYDDRFHNPLGRTFTLGARYEF